MEQELEKISGTVEDVTYHNEESGFTVLLVDVDGDPVTVVGEVPEIAEGELPRPAAIRCTAPTGCSSARSL